MNQVEARSVPTSIAICPICGAKLWIESIDQAVEADDGQLIPDEVAVDCSTMPDIDSEEWKEWHRWHWSTPYVDWLPVSGIVLKWLQSPDNQERFETIWNSPGILPGPD